MQVSGVGCRPAMPRACDVSFCGASWVGWVPLAGERRQVRGGVRHACLV